MDSTDPYRIATPAGTIEEGTRHPQGEPPYVRGLFDDPADAQEAWERLCALGVKPQDIDASVAEGPAGQDAEVRAGTPPAPSMAGGALTVGALGAVLGGLVGWMVSIRAIGIPGIGLVGDASVPASTVGGIVLGAAVGALVGALLASGTGQTDAAHEGRARTVLTVHPSGVDPRAVEFALSDSGAVEVHTHYGYPAEVADAMVASAAPATGEAADDRNRTIAGYSTEDYDMQEEFEGRDLDIPTGTGGAIDPETGAFGTAGTPLTTGSEVSGATVGTGTPETKRAYDRGDFPGATPDTAEYDAGGRASADAAERADGEPLPPVERRLQARPHDQEQEQEAAARAEQDEGVGAGDIYAQEASQDLQPRPQPATTPDAGIDVEPPQASEGTNIPGTSNPRGLGDNTG